MKLSDDMVASLEEFLLEDSTGELRGQIISALVELQQRLTHLAQKLNSPEDFKAIEAARKAAHSAMLVMIMTEGELHPTRRMPWQTCVVPD